MARRICPRQCNGQKGNPRTRKHVEGNICSAFPQGRNATNCVFAMESFEVLTYCLMHRIPLTWALIHNGLQSPANSAFFDSCLATASLSAGVWLYHTGSIPSC